MFSSLSIRDLAVVDSLDLEFEPGFTVLTGETGAGKSILLTALGLALGDRADSGLVRPGARRAEVTLGFDLDPAADANRWLEANELAEGDCCLIRRVVSSDGRSKAFINSRPVTLQALQDFGALLVEIHGQHAHLALFQTAEQRRLLDRSGADQELPKITHELFTRWKSLNRELAEHCREAADRTAREDLLRYQLEELERHAVSTLDYQELTTQHTRLANVGRIGTLGQEQLELLYENEQHSANRLLVQALHAMRELEQLAPELCGISTMLQEAEIQVKEAAAVLRHALERLESEPQRLEAVEERLADIHRLARKHQVAPAVLPTKFEELRNELDHLVHGAERVGELENAAAETARAYEAAADRLSEQRAATAQRLGQRISEMIRELGMPHGRFEIAVQPRAEKEPTAFGTDRIDFLVAANPGLPPRPIGKVASGGELSRISLAIQVSAIDYKKAPSLIFDEVDSGIGGRVAEIVGQKLRFLAGDRQVFCVTHLPQVAALGQNHLLVEKQTQDQVTQTSVRPLSVDERTHEIARMLGGVRITEQTLAHAAEMLGWVNRSDTPQSPHSRPSTTESPA